MEYRVEITENAYTETDEAYFWLSESSPDAALRWYDGLLDSFRSLTHLPERCSIAPESKWFEQEIRQLLYGKYRILFSTNEDVVYVLHVRHSSRDYIRS